MTQTDQQHAVSHIRVRDAVIRVVDASTDPGVDDASDTYVMEVFGTPVLIRLRTTTQSDVFIHIDNESTEPTSLALEVSNGGETRFDL